MRASGNPKDNDRKLADLIDMTSPENVMDEVGGCLGDGKPLLDDRKILPRLGDYARAESVNDRGEIVGLSGDLYRSIQACLWRPVEE